ncbi:MAG: hypothetical protein ACLSH8_15580 [Zhenhengia sp.]|jgi:hypothetical protein|uniref:hypothetical protein n=1 Tax=Zhenhengia sp. TaxID=2944208 RepID=UPI002907753D|nr:hypothetical protein [Clostridiales bacterium]MDU6974900.1 hypothetical protein [Clostridiales bacterium]
MNIDETILKTRNGMEYILDIYEVPKQDFAKEFGVEPSAISNWKTRGVPKKYAKKIEERFGIEIKYFNKQLTPHEQLMLKNQKQNRELMEEAMIVTESIKDENGNVFEIEATHIDLMSAKETAYEISRRNMTYNMLMMLQQYEKINDDGVIDFAQASDRVQALESFIRLLTHKQLNLEIVQMIIDAIRDAEGLPRSDYGIEPQNEEFVKSISSDIKQLKNGGQQDGQK